MKHKILLITLLLTAGILAGCQKAEEKEQSGQRQEEVSKEQEAVSSEEDAALKDKVSPAEALPSAEEGQKEGASQGFTFADVTDREFYFSSGAGAWYTVLYIHENGTFEGHYQDMDMGVTGEGYPNGTLYYSDFSGSFTEPVKLNDTTYVFQIESMEYAHDFGEEVKDGYLYCYGEAYGLFGAKDFYMYLPGAKIADLPEAYRSWVGYYNPESVSETELPFYGLYNVEQENGFSSYAYEEQSAAEQIKAELSKAEEKASKLEVDLKNAQAQADLNVISGEIYKAWDEALNAIWAILKENLDEESMKKLTEEERSWIAQKEASVKEAGAEFEGGSIYALIVNQKAAELTKERVYVLAEYLQ